MVWHGVHLATIARQINLLKEYHQTDPELLNLSDDAYGMTPLIWACVMGHEDVVAFLLDHGADIEREDHGKRSACFYASKMGNATQVQTLLRRGAGMTRQSVEGMTPLIIAAACGHEDVVTALLAHLASDAFFAPTAATAIGTDGISRANTQPALGPTGAGDLVVVATATDAPALDEAGQAKARLALLNATTRRGNTAVHCSARHPSILRRLLAAGANPTLVNVDGHTALDIARGKQVPASVRILQKHLEGKEQCRVRVLHKARALSDAAHCLSVVAAGNHRTRGQKRRALTEAAPPFLKGRVAREEALPTVAVAGGSGSGGDGGQRRKRRGREDDTKEVRRAVAAHVASGGLKPDLFMELMEFMVPKWDKARQGRPAQA